MKWKPVRMAGRLSGMLQYDALFTAIKPSRQATVIRAAKNRLGKERNAVHGAAARCVFPRSHRSVTDHAERSEQVMKISIVKERRPHETRVAATPGNRQEAEGAGRGDHDRGGCRASAAAYTDQAYADAGATIVPDAAAAIAAGDIVFKIQRPMSAAEGIGRACAAAPGPDPDVAARCAHQQGPRAGAGVEGRDVFCTGADPAHHACAVDGYPVLAGQSRGLQGGAAGGQQLRPHLPADDDARRHAGAVARLHHGCRRCRPAGDRHGAAPRLDRDGDRRAARRPRNRSSRSAPSSSPSRTRSSRRRRRPAAMPRR